MMTQSPLMGSLMLLHIFCASTAPTKEAQNLKAGIPNGDGEPVDLLISFRSSEKQNHQRLYGSFSAAGRNYETSGDIVQVFPYRACDMKRKGYDRTLIDHIAVVFFDELEPFITGCVSLDNQVRFAEKSGALGLVVGPESRVVAQVSKLQRGSIPVVTLTDVETQHLRRQLDEASRSGSVVKLELEYVQTKPQYTLRLQVFRPTVLNIGLMILLFLLILFITGLVFIKIRWRPTSHRDIWLRTLARSAVNKMEIRKFEKPGTQPISISGDPKKGRGFLCLASKRRYLPVFGSLTSVAPSCINQERCSICLDEYKEGQELRVLFCGHEFHPKCVDPWLLSNRRCPLCQYDVVYKEYPKVDSAPKNNRASSLPSGECANQQDLPLLSTSAGGNADGISLLPTGVAPYMQIPQESMQTEKKQQRHRHSRHENLCVHPYSLGPTTSAVPQVISVREIRRYRNRETSGGRTSRRCLQHRARSLGATNRRRQQRPRRMPPVDLRVSVLSKDQAPQAVDAFSGYSSDVSSYPELEGSHDLLSQELPYFTLSSTHESSSSSTLRPSVFEFTQNISVFPSAPTLEKISFEESQAQIC